MQPLEKHSFTLYTKSFPLPNMRRQNKLNANLSFSFLARDRGRDATNLGISLDLVTNP
jgi:hypothetical protein